MLEQFIKNCSPIGGIHIGAGGECEDEGAAEVLTVIPIAHSWCITVREEVENSGMKSNPGKGGGTGRYFKVCFCFPLPLW